MNPPAITLEVLPAGYGDCLLISCPVGKRTWRLLVDTGPDECWPSLRARLAEIAPDHHGKRHIDLAVITVNRGAIRGPVRLLKHGLHALLPRL